MIEADAIATQWERPGQRDPLTLADARDQLHWAAQGPMAVADALLEKLPDDSQSNLGWEDGTLVGRDTPDGRRVRLRLADLTLSIDGGDSIALEGLTLDDEFEWLGSQFDARIEPRDYKMPDHPVRHGSPFSLDDREAFATITRGYANASHVLELLVANDGRAPGPRCWPHHFDLGTLITLEANEDPEKTTSIGVGWLAGDDNYPQPYWYVMPYPTPSTDAPPTLAGGGTWHLGDWFSAVLLGHDNPSDIAAFLDSSIAICEDMLAA